MAKRKGNRRSEIRFGTIFELGPDGYGYILDSREPDRSYAFRINQIAGICRASANFETLEGAAVTFRLAAGGQIEQLSLVNARVGTVKDALSSQRTRLRP